MFIVLQLVEAGTPSQRVRDAGFWCPYNAEKGRGGGMWGGGRVKMQRAHEGKGEKGLLILKCQALPLGHILSQTVPQFLSLNIISLRVSAPT